MRTYLILFIIAALSALLGTPLIRRRAIAWGAVAVPDKGRHIHAAPTPRLGGIAIYLAFVLTLCLVPLSGNLVSTIFTANLPRIVALLIPATLIFAFGIYDDFHGAGAPTKIIFQTIAAGALFASGLRIENLSSPLGGYWRLPLLLSFLLTALWVILIFSIAQGNPEISLLSIILLGAVLGFLRYNFNPATIFLGDSGSLFLGFMAAALSLAGSQKGSTIVAIAIPLVSFGLPLTEAGLSLLRRFLSGAPLLAGDRGHIHHRLLDRGLTQRQAAIILYGVCGLFSLFGLMLLNPQRNIGALVFFIIGVGLILGVQHLRYPEFAELGHQIRRSVHRRRRTMVANVHLRRFGADLGQVTSPGELTAALAALPINSEFETIRVELANADLFWSAGTGTESSRNWRLSIPLLSEEGRVIGRIILERDLQRGLPLLELGSLSENLAREVARAIERLGLYHSLTEEPKSLAGKTEAGGVESTCGKG
jgi:UDP-GlcNAc:undecaprenyl-phosphate GlcNAc-1-phosphate transferase